MTEPKRFKRQATTFEYLPNELFVEIFGYLNGVDAVYAFSQLNIRIQYLLDDYVNIFDFKSISKAKFNLIIQLHHPHRWRSLCLSDDDHTPRQIEHFCQLFPPAESVHQLQSLSVLNMNPKDAREFVLQMRSFNNLVSLSIGRICGTNIQPINLPLLKRLKLTSCKHTHWLMNLHSLQSMEYTIQHTCYHKPNLILPTTLRRFRIFYKEGSDGNDVRAILHRMSQLTTLALCDNGSDSPLPNGRIWEELIVSSLPLLHTFQFNFPFAPYHHVLGDVDETISSFSTPFYLFEKRWFIRCDRSSKHLCLGAVYSLPFAFSNMFINTASFETSLSTLPDTDINETKSDYYTKLNTLTFTQECKEPHVGFLTSNIIHLILKVRLPISWLYLLTHLRHLTLDSNVEMLSTDFAQLLQYTPNLQALSIPIIKLKLLTDQFSNEIVCQQLSQRIKSLIISSYYSNAPTPNFDIVSLRLLCSLARIFSSNCEHLSLAVRAHPTSVRPILRRMKQLRSLHIECRYGHHRSDDLKSYWLQRKSTDFIHTNDDKHLFVWFGNRF